MAWSAISLELRQSTWFILILFIFQNRIFRNHKVLILARNCYITSSPVCGEYTWMADAASRVFVWRFFVCIGEIVKR